MVALRNFIVILRIDHVGVLQSSHTILSKPCRYGVAMESTEDQGAKATIDSLRQAVCEELQMHSSLAEVPFILP